MYRGKHRTISLGIFDLYLALAIGLLALLVWVVAAVIVHHSNR